MYRAYVTRASEGEWDNSGIIERILKLRQEEARLLGYHNLCGSQPAPKDGPHRGRRGRDVPNPQGCRLGTGQARPGGPGSSWPRNRAWPNRSKHWDIPFWSERLREKRFNFTDEELRPYFPLERVMNGLFDLVERLFAIQVKPADGEAPVWHPDVGSSRFTMPRARTSPRFISIPIPGRRTNRAGPGWRPA